MGQVRSIGKSEYFTSSADITSCICQTALLQFHVSETLNYYNCMCQLHVSAALIQLHVSVALLQLHDYNCTCQHHYYNCTCQQHYYNCTCQLHSYGCTCQLHYYGCMCQLHYYSCTCLLHYYGFSASYIIAAVTGSISVLQTYNELFSNINANSAKFMFWVSIST